MKVTGSEHTMRYYLGYEIHKADYALSSAMHGGCLSSKNCSRTSISGQQEVDSSKLRGLPVQALAAGHQKFLSVYMSAEHPQP